MDLRLIVEIFSLLPPLTFGTPAEPKDPPAGTATLMISNCEPGTRVTVMPLKRAVPIDATGRAQITVPAQAHDDDPYEMVYPGGSSALPGSLEKNETLSLFCG